MPEAAWQGGDGYGYLLGGEFFCCRQCAHGVGCACYFWESPLPGRARIKEVVPPGPDRAAGGLATLPPAHGAGFP